MATYLIRRLLLIIPTLLGMTIVIFCVMAFSPGGIAGAVLNSEGQMRPAERAEVERYYNERYGLDKPLPVQYLRWLNKVSPIGFPVRQPGDPLVIAARGASEAQRAAGNEKAKPAVRAGDVIIAVPWFKWPDLGDSYFRKRPVLDLIKEALPVTLLMNLIVFPIVYIVAITTGVLAARGRGGAFDVASGTTMLGLWSVPQILTCVLAIGFLASKQYLPWFPTNGLHDLLADEMPFLPQHDASGAWERGYLLDAAWHLALPLLCLGYGQFAVLAKLARSSVLDNLYSDYARTARAKGLAANDVLYRHVFRNSLLPLITVAAGILPAMLGGAVIVERVFGITGMGRLGVDAVFEKDTELVLSVSMIMGLLGLVGYLLADIGYAIADPRVSYDA